MNDKKQKKKKILALIDGNALVHRAYHALPPLTTKDSRPSGAVYGFALTLFGMIDKVKPDYIIASFDVKGPTFRHKEFKEYKANRKKAPDDLYEQIPMCQDLLKSYGIPIYIKEGFEADDVLGTISKDEKIETALDTLIVTGDMDLAQLVDKDTSIFTLRRGVKDTIIYDEKGVMEKYHIRPDQIIDYKALRGDPSDNIPGVKGVGEKTALDLLQQFEYLEEIYNNLDKIEKPAVKKKLEENKKEAFLSYKLATIVTDVPVQVDLSKARIDRFNKEGLGKYLQKMGFQSLHKRLIGAQAQTGARGEVVPQGGTISDGRGATSRSVGQFEFTEIKNKKNLSTLVNKIKKNKKVSYYLGTNSNKFYSAKILGIGISISDNKIYYLNSSFLAEFKNILSNEVIKKNGYEVKLSLELFNKNIGFNLGKAEGFFDVKLASYLLGQGQRDDLEKMIFEEFGESFQSDGRQGNQASLLGGLEENQKKLIAEKAGWVSRLAEVYEDKFNSKETQIKKVFVDLEMPLVKVLAKMEINGVKINKKALEMLSKMLGKKLNKLEKKIYKLTNEKFNINSPSQLAVVLFEKMQLPTKGIKKGKTGYSTDVQQLEKLKDIHPVIKFIEEYRTHAKLKSTYSDPLAELMQDDGRIHANFNQTGAVTGRLSSSDPNLQNVPKYGEVSKLIRQAFIADKGKILVAADYSQIDLRVAAYLSQDLKMIQIFKEGQDIHKSTAAWINNIKLSDVTKEQRSEAKSLNFGVLYGMGIYGFMRDSGVDYERAEFFIQQYMKTFSKLKEFIEKVKEDARKNSYVETEFGRRRYFPAINASNPMARSGAERAAINFPIQGLAADIMKLAMLKVDEELLQDDNCKLELQIHDELIIEVDEDQAEKFSKKLKKIMEEVYELNVPLVVEVSIGDNWGEL